METLQEILTEFCEEFDYKGEKFFPFTFHIINEKYRVREDFSNYLRFWAAITYTLTSISEDEIKDADFMIANYLDLIDDNEIPTLKLYEKSFPINVPEINNFYTFFENFFFINNSLKKSYETMDLENKLNGPTIQ